MPRAPFLVSLTLTQPTAAVRTGKLTVVANLGDSVGPLTIEIPGVTDGIVSMDGATTDASQYGYSQAGVAPGRYQATVHDASPAHLADFTTDLFTVNEPPPLVPGCTDPDADNYDPLASDDNGSCVFTQRLALAPLPELAPLGVPLTVGLQSVTVPGAVPALASVVLELAALVSSALPTGAASLRVDGYLFTFGPLIVPGRFVDAPSLLAALLAQPALAASYVLSQPTATSVRLVATGYGLPATPVVSVSNPLLIGVATTLGTAQYHSERRQRWGCWLEVWAGCGATYGGPTTKASAVLAQRFDPLPYRAENTYQFDIATTLRQFTGHAYPQADGTCPDRLVSYFVRFGESYADTATGLRRVRNTYESPICWGLEAVELPAEVAPGLRLLTARPGPWRVAPGQLLPATVLAKPDPARRLLVRARSATSRLLAGHDSGRLTAVGQPTQALNRLPGAGVLSGVLYDSDYTDKLGAVLASLVFDAVGPAFTFVNRQGSTDTVHFAGNADENTKRTAASFTSAAGPATLSAEVSLPTKLAGLFDYATWAWLRRELAVSPAAWLETEAGPLPILLTDVSTESDSIKNEYSISVEYQSAPVRGLSN